MSKRKRCIAKTKSGSRCRKKTATGADTCHLHLNGKPTAAEIELRIQRVYEMIVTGEASADICRYMSEKCGISKRQVERYVSEATDRLKKISQSRSEVHFDLMVARLNDLYKKNYAIQDYKECRLVIESTAKMMKTGKPGKATPKNVKPINHRKTVTGYTPKNF